MSGNGIQLLRRIVDGGVKAKGFENVLSKIRVISGGNGQAVCELTVTEEHQNRLGTLHGGVTATLVDAVSTWALMTTGELKPGVSVNMNITYMKAARLGEDILIEAASARVGKKMAFLNVDIKSKTDGSLIAQGQHTKYVGS